MAAHSHTSLNHLPALGCGNSGSKKLHVSGVLCSIPMERSWKVLSDWPNYWRGDVDTERFTVGLQVDMAAWIWRWGFVPFCLTEFNSTLSEYHKTKLLRRSRFWSQMLVSQVFRWWGKVGILGWMVIGRHPRDHVTRFAPLCCLTYSNSGWAKSMLREFFAYYL